MLKIFLAQVESTLGIWQDNKRHQRLQDGVCRPDHVPSKVERPKTEVRVLQPDQSGKCSEWPGMGFNSQQWAKLGNKKPSQLDFHFTYSQRPPFRSINYVLVQPQVRLRGWEDEISDNDGSKKGFLLQAMRKKEYHWRFGQVWMPDTFFRNEKSGHFHNILVNNVYIRCNISFAKCC